MTDKKNDLEINHSKDQLSIVTESITIDFQKSDALLGQILDERFLIEKDLTETGSDAGGIGLVYLAKDTKLMGREVVVKILRQAALKSEHIARKFQHEKEALIRLDHPNIVRILDSGTLSDGNPFMVMEYIAGHSLRRALQQNGKLPFDLIAHITESVTDALSAAHSKKILHRDIKPANIMLTPQDEGFDRVRLIDFGIARVEDSQLASDTATQRSIGTLLYIAPEQLWGNIEQTPAIDIYAFAIVIYEMLTEQLPFKPGSIVEMFELQKEGVKVLPSKLRTDLPVEAEKVLLSALDFEAEKRPQNARAFGRDFVSALLKDTNYETNNELVTSDLETIYPLPLKSGLFTQAATTLPSIGSQETNFPNINFPGAAKKNSNKWLMWGLLGLLLVFALSIPVGIALWNNSGQTPPVNITNTNTVEKTNNSSGSQRELTYFLNVQKMRDGEPFEEPFKSSGQEIFENGYKFKMVFQSDAKGFLYLFNEDKGTQGKTIYHILYPTPKTKNGSAQVSAKEQIETSNNTFSGLRGTELVWLIWTAQIQNDLEAVKQSAFNAKGTIRDEESVKKLADLLQKYSNEKNEISKDTASQQTIIRGNGDVVVNQIHLEHR